MTAAQSIVVFRGLSILNIIVSMLPAIGGVISSLISRAGFTPRMRQIAEEEGVILIGLEDMLQT